MAEYTEWCPELEAALTAPFPPEAHKTKKQGGAEIVYVSWHEYAQRLNELVGPQGWCAEMPVLTEVGGKLVQCVPVTILGVTKVNVGDEDEAKDSYGTAATNGWAQGFKRTCALFGLGLYMYDKLGRAQSGRQQAAQRAPRPAQNGNGGSRERPATEKQLRMIDRLVLERAIDAEPLAQFQRRLSRGLTAAEASHAIDWLSSLPAETAGAASS